MRLLRVLATGGLAVAVASAVPAQEVVVPQDNSDAPAAAIEEQARVDLVLVDVIAYDRRGRLVTDLREDDFVVREDRKRVDLESFEVVDFRGVGAPAGSIAAIADAPTAEGVPVKAQRTRAQLIVLDLEFADRFALRKTFEELDRFVRGLERRPGRSYLIYTMQDGALTPQYEEDPRRILTALHRYRDRVVDTDRSETEGGVRSSRAGGAAVPSGTPQTMTDLERIFESCRFGGEMGAATQAAGRTGAAWARTFLACLREPLQLYLEGQYARTARALTLLEDLTEGVGQPAQPNAVLFVSPGFSVRPGRTAVQLAAHYFNLAQSTDDPRLDEQGAPPLPSQVNPFPAPRDFRDELRHLIDTCARRRVIFHTFDIYNANVDLDRRSSAEFDSISPTIARGYEEYKSEMNEGLQEVATQSGGTFHSGATLDPMRTAMEQSGLIYTLGYRTTPGDPDDFRKIRIECKRSGVTLHYRSGYYPEPAVDDAG